MSLMNDALRKKNRETLEGRAKTGVSDAIRHPRPTGKWVAVLAAVVLLTAATLVGIRLMPSDAAIALLPKPPLPDRSNLSAERAIGVRPAVEAPADTGVGQMPIGSAGTPLVTGGEPAAAGPATIQVPAAPAAATMKANVPDDRPPSRVTTTDTHDDKWVATAIPDGPRTADIPVEAPAKRSATAHHGFEPGPAPTVRHASPPSPSPMQAGTPEAPLPSRSDTTGEADAARTIRQPGGSGAGADIFYKKARSYHRSGRLTDAVRLYRRVLNTCPNHPGAMLNLAAATMQQGNFVDAHPLLKRLERSTPRPQGVFLNLAIASIGTGAPEQALTYLDRAAAISDASPWEIRFHRAVAFARMNRLTDALVLYRAAEKERPDAPGLQFNLAVTCDALGLYPEALTHYQAVLQANLEPSATDQATITRRIRTLGKYLHTAPAPAKG